MSRSSALPLLLLVACTPTGRAWRLGGAELTVDPSPIDFGVVPLDTPATSVLTVTNTGTTAVTLAVATPVPFASDRTTVDVGAGGTATLTVTFTPTDYADAAGDLTLTSAAVTTTVPLLGRTDPDSDADGHSATAVGGDDCDDADPDANPDAPETCYDGVDNDCNGAANDTDCDGDGISVSADCDDLDPTVSPDAAEAGPDGRDDDCDGLVDENLHTPGALVLTEIRTGPDVAIELCNTLADPVYLDHLVLESDGGSVDLDPTTARDPSPLTAGACAAFAPVDSGYFTWELVLPFEPSGDHLAVLSEGTAVDEIAVAPAWGWDDDTTYALSGGADAVENDAPAAWCATTAPTWGSANPADPCP